MVASMKRWPIIRHLRWLYHYYGFYTWWHQVGQHLGAFPSPYDLQFLDDIWEGKA